MSSRLTVYTCLTVGKDRLRSQERGSADFVAFTDEPEVPEPWERRPAYDRFTDPRRNSRIQKIMPHLYLDCDYSVYLDANVSLLVPPEALVAEHLADHDVAVYRHPTRDCLYQEALECAKRGLDDPEVIIEQARAYEVSGWAKNRGLAECGVIIRRHTTRVERFNEAWWAHFSRYSRRDQLSFMVAAERSGVRVKLIDDYFVPTTADAMVKQSGQVDIVAHQLPN